MLKVGQVYSSMASGRNPLEPFLTITALKEDVVHYRYDTDGAESLCFVGDFTSWLNRIDGGRLLSSPTVYGNYMGVLSQWVNP
jgi:hypothetical protein